MNPVGRGIPGPATYHGAHCDFGAFGKLCHDGLYKGGMEWIECNRTRHFFLFDCGCGRIFALFGRHGILDLCEH
jgi:hypothetical protein